MIDMNFTASPGSTVYLMAFNKHLNSLAKANDEKIEDFIKNEIDYDEFNQITVIDMEESSWQCTMQELTRIRKGLIRTDYGQPIKAFKAVYDDNDNESNSDYDEELSSEDIAPYVNEPQKTCNINGTKSQEIDASEDPKDTWIFDNFDVADGTVSKSYKAPDSSTSKIPWMISSFSINEVHGLAVGEPMDVGFSEN